MPVAVTKLAIDRDYIELCAQGKRQLFRGDMSVPMRLLPAEREAFDAAKIAGYITLHRGKRANLENVWWRWCELGEQPYVRVALRRRYADVSLDLATTDREFFGFTHEDPAVVAYCTALKELMFSQAVVGTRWWVGDWPECRVPIEQAPMVATGMLRIFNEHRATLPALR